MYIGMFFLNNVNIGSCNIKIYICKKVNWILVYVWIERGEYDMGDMGCVIFDVELW